MFGQVEFSATPSNLLVFKSTCILETVLRRAKRANSLVSPDVYFVYQVRLPLRNIIIIISTFIPRQTPETVLRRQLHNREGVLWSNTYICTAATRSIETSQYLMHLSILMSVKTWPTT